MSTFLFLRLSAYGLGFSSIFFHVELLDRVRSREDEFAVGVLEGHHQHLLGNEGVHHVSGTLGIYVSARGRIQSDDRQTLGVQRPRRRHLAER